MSDKTVYTYLSDKNPGEAHLPGVPLRDLTEADIAAMPAWLRAWVAACPFYRATTREKGERKETTP